MPAVGDVSPWQRPSVRSRSAHIASLDGLRGVAIILVVFFHVALVSPNSRGAEISWLGHVRQSGWIGVEMFYALSGFLITGILLQTIRDPQYLRNFYLRRVLRIFPLYYGALAVLAIVGVILHLSWHGSVPYLLLYVQNFRTGIRQLNLEMSGGGIFINLRHFWSLAVEEQFYLVWPFLVLLTRGKRWFLWVPLVFIVVCPALRWIAWERGVAFAPLRYWTFFRADSLAWGGLGAAVQRFFTERDVRRYRIATLGVGGVVCAGVFGAEHGYFLEALAPTVRIFYSSFGAFCCGLILVVVHGQAWVVRLFRVGLLRWFGRYSYGIYVIHLPLMSVYEQIRYAVIRATGSRPLGALALVGSAFGLSALLAWVSYHGYERHFLSLKDKIAAYSVAERISRR